MRQKENICLPRNELPFDQLWEWHEKEKTLAFIFGSVTQQLCTDRCIFERIQLPCSLIKFSEDVMKNCVISWHGKGPGAQFVLETHERWSCRFSGKEKRASFVQVCKNRGPRGTAGRIPSPGFLFVFCCKRSHLVFPTLADATRSCCKLLQMSLFLSDISGFGE